MVSSRTVNVTSTINGSGVTDGAVNTSREDERRATNGVGVPQEWNQSGPPSLSMSVDLHNFDSSTLTDSGRYSASPDDHQAASANATTIKIDCHDEEESYEGFGSVEGDSVDDGPESPGGSSSTPSPIGTNLHRNPRSPNSTIGKHSWLRTSLRRTPPCSSRKRLSSNALASQLYRSGSFNSSGMGSNYDATDDVYSDVSLEDVMDLSHKTARTQDAVQNYPAEFLRCTERNEDHGPSYVDPSESSSLTDAITKTFVNPVYENNNQDESEIEDSETVQNEFVTDTERVRSIHRYFHFEK
ncbi:hypothetical protein ALC62_15857 [Cyphomyrmex costatus]|uniref:Uncharacterized protein n=1 Tax=Cyphomyrmex costatus TaxID=456900 RepID=A0A195BXW4_9HYME|nr:hypothetical protein ALC62_15857 [Cyphomyrmex costatus]